MSHALTSLAFETLKDAAVTSGLRSVACSTLLAAFETRVEVPAGSHLACWRFLLGSDACSVLLHRHAIEHPEVARDAIRVLTDGEHSQRERDLALAVLRGSNVEHVRPEDLVAAVDRVLDESSARQLSHLMERVHEEVGLTLEFITAIRDRLAGSAVSAVRVVAVEVCGLSSRLDDHFAIRMLADPAPPVRAAVADRLERTEEVDRGRAVVVVREQLQVETHVGRRGE